jgi:hypothetical protein
MRARWEEHGRDCSRGALWLVGGEHLVDVETEHVQSRAGTSRVFVPEGGDENVPVRVIRPRGAQGVLGRSGHPPD